MIRSIGRSKEVDGNIGLVGTFIDMSMAGRMKGLVGKMNADNTPIVKQIMAVKEREFNVEVLDLKDCGLVVVVEADRLGTKPKLAAKQQAAISKKDMSRYETIGVIDSTDISVDLSFKQTVQFSTKFGINSKSFISIPLTLLIFINHVTLFI